MSMPAWELDQQTARLRLERILARLVLARPDRGLHDVRLETRSLADAELLAVAFPSSAKGEARCSFECHQRGRDLIAAYHESLSWPVCVDTVWRAIRPAEASGMLGGVDLIASVRTALLDTWPELAVRSRVSAVEVMRLADAEAARFEPCGGIPDSECVVDSAAGPCLFVFRLPGLPFSYAEMTHPADFQGTVLAPSRDAAAVVETRHRLFAEHLEKGVILRARVRGVVLERAQDLQAAAACYAEFAAADPPLGT
jgi:hypothetical protein